MEVDDGRDGLGLIWLAGENLTLSVGWTRYRTDGETTGGAS